MAAETTLREITKETVRLVTALDVGPDQHGLVAPNSVSIAEAYFEPKAWFRAIYFGEEPAGFAMVWRDPDERVLEDRIDEQVLHPDLGQVPGDERLIVLPQPVGDLADRAPVPLRRATGTVPVDASRLAIQASKWPWI